MSTTVPSQSAASSSVVFERPDRYEVDAESPLERAETGSLFEAYDKLLEQTAVLRLLRPGLTDESSRERFERKARKLCQLNHPNLVPLNDFGYHHGLAYVARERVDGTRLDAYIEEHGPLGFHEFAPIAAAILEGLAELHQFRIVHGDIQPENIWLETNGDEIHNTAIAGFGLPDLQSEPDDIEEKTKRVARTPAVAPERIQGQGADERLDIYAFGVTAYYMLCGEPPFEEGRDGLESLYQHLHDHPPLLTHKLPSDHSIPPIIVEFVHRMMAKNPDDRPADAEEAVQWFVESVEDKRVFRFDRNVAPTPEAHPRELSGSSPEELTAKRPHWTRDSTSGSFPSMFAAAGEGRTFDTGSAPGFEQSRGLPGWSAASRAIRRLREWGGQPLGRTGAALAVGAVLLGTAATYALVSNDAQPSDNREKTPAAAHEPDGTEGMSRERFRERLTGIAQAIENREFKTAQTLLDTLRADLQHSNRNRIETTQPYETQIRLGRSFDRGRRLERNGELERALEAYGRVLELDPDHERAENARQRLQSSFALRVDANVRASVFVDGTLVGTTPVAKILEPEKSRLTVRRAGYEVWRRSISPETGKTLEFTVDLDRRRPNRAPDDESPSGAEQSDAPFGGDQLMEMSPY